jgi:outer membrane immunogenic protein
MHRYVIAAIAVVTATGMAAAADFPSMPIKAPPAMQALYNWTGFYLGANAGGGWSDVDNEFGTFALPAFASLDHSLKGAIGGVQTGYNWQQGAMVFGVETDFQFSGMKGGVDAPCPPVLCAGIAASFNQKLPWFGTVRGRIGVASQGWLIYATGGFAYARLKTHAFASAGGVAVDVTNSENRNGWTAGGGIEVALMGNWTAKVEYLYLDFGSKDNNWALLGLPILTDSARLQSNIVRGGVNYRF